MINTLSIAGALAICLLFSGLPACQPAGEEPPGWQATVSPRGRLQHVMSAVDLETAVESVSPGTEIVLQPGLYIVDNPMTLYTSDLVIRGAGVENTRIVPKNEGQPVFRLAADGIALESITINALLTDESGRASHAIEISKEHGDCLIAHTKILNTGASAIIGNSAPGCTLVNNVILNSGDDAVRLRGDRLTLVNNIIIGYFDEALDLAGGSNIIVTGNLVSHGRIGIVVDNSNNALIARNIVYDHLNEGIVTGADREAVVTGNIVIDAGRIAYNLHSSRVVIGNRADGGNETGFSITDIVNAIVSGNTVRGSQQGFVLGAAGETVTVNATDDSITGSTTPLMITNCVQLRDSTVTHDCPDLPGSPDVQTAMSQVHDFMNDPEIQSFTLPVDIQGTTSVDADTARQIAAELEYYNPGFLSIHVDGAVMRSQITEDLYKILLGAGKQGIGLMRAPFLRFSSRRRSFYWYLSYADTDVVMASSRYGGASVRLTNLQDGQPGYMDSMIMVADNLLLKFLQ